MVVVGGGVVSMSRTNIVQIPTFDSVYPVSAAWIANPANKLLFTDVAVRR